MTRYFLSIFTFIFILAINSFAQENKDSAQTSRSTVDTTYMDISTATKVSPELFCSGSLGLNAARIKCSHVNNNQTHKSFCLLYDIRLGLALTKFFAIHLDYISTNPIILDENIKTYTATVTSISEHMYGGGFTYYFYPKNSFISGAVGLGTITQYGDNNKKVTFSSNSGFTFQLKAGYEKKINKYLSIGIGCSFLKSSITSDINEEWSNTHYTLGAILTFKY